MHQLIPHILFEHGSANNDMLGIKGREKEGKWFASANNQNRFLDPRERGHWLNYLRICIRIARAVRRMHAAGLAHSSLSYKNVLIDPSTGQACLIDIDGLVVPGKFPPEVVGTPDFIAPEVVATAHLPRHNATGNSLALLLIAMPLRYWFTCTCSTATHSGEQNPMIQTRSVTNRSQWVSERSLLSTRPIVVTASGWRMPGRPSCLGLILERVPYAVTGPYFRII